MGPPRAEVGGKVLRFALRTPALALVGGGRLGVRDQARAMVGTGRRDHFGNCSHEQ